MRGAHIESKYLLGIEKLKRKTSIRFRKSNWLPNLRKSAKPFFDEISEKLLTIIMQSLKSPKSPKKGFQLTLCFPLYLIYKYPV